MKILTRFLTLREMTGEEIGNLIEGLIGTFE